MIGRELVALGSLPFAHLMQAYFDCKCTVPFKFNHPQKYCSEWMLWLATLVWSSACFCWRFCVLSSVPVSGAKPQADYEQRIEAWHPPLTEDFPASVASKSRRCQTYGKPTIVIIIEVVCADSGMYLYDARQRSNTACDACLRWKSLQVRQTRYTHIVSWTNVICTTSTCAPDSLEQLHDHRWTCHKATDNNGSAVLTAIQCCSKHLFWESCWHNGCSLIMQSDCLANLGRVESSIGKHSSLLSMALLVVGTGVWVRPAACRW